MRLPSSNAPQPVFRLSTMASQPFVFPYCPSDQSSVQMSQGLVKRRFIKAAIVVYPASDDRAEHPRQILQGFITSQVHFPSSRRLSHRLSCFITYCRREVYELFTPSVPRPPRPEGKTQKVKTCIGIITPTVIIFAVDNLRLLRVKLQSASLKSNLKRRL